MNRISFNSDFIAGMKFHETFGRYKVLCKSGVTCTFGIEQLSNQRHVHDCFEICIITSGAGKYIHNYEEYNIQKGDIIVADKGVQHEIQSVNFQDMQLIYFFIDISVNSSLDTVKSLEDTLIHNFITRHDIIAPSKMYILTYLDFIESYNMLSGSPYFGTCWALKSLVLECLAALSCKNELLNTYNVSQSSFERALDYIDANLHNKILIKDIASYALTSERNLQYLFRKNLNKTIIGYTNEKKIEQACYYLQMQLSISDVARLVGVPDLVQFSRLFKKYKEMTPKRYQEIVAPGKKGMGRRV